MSVQKYVIKKNQSNFTIIHNTILQKLNNYEALGLYCYIASLPPEWEFHKNHLASHASIGRDKLTSLLKLLEAHGLVKIEQVRDKDGRFGIFNMHVYGVEEFKISPKPRQTSPLTEKPLTANRLPVNRTYKEYIEKENIKEKENISCSSDDELDCFDIFWSFYPRKQDKKDAKKLWDRLKLDKKAAFIVEDVKKRTNGEWKGKIKQYIPLPSTYLNAERWEDEYIDSTDSKLDQNFNGLGVAQAINYTLSQLSSSKGI